MVSIQICQIYPQNICLNLEIDVEEIIQQFNLIFVYNAPSGFSRPLCDTHQ